MITLTVLSQTTTKITFGWTPVPCVGYAFYADGVRKSNTWDPTTSKVTFAKGSKLYRVDALGVADTGSYPPPVPPPVGNVLELSGSFTSWDFATQVAAAPAGPLTVRPKAGSSVTVLGSYTPRAGLTMEHITFDGQGNTANNWLTDVDGFVYRACTIKGYFTADPASHSEGLYVGGGMKNGLIEDCVFDNNGTTAHIFFTWFGSSQGGGAYDQNNYPRNICVRRSTFTNCHNPYFDIQMRDEIPDSCGINIDPSNVFEHGTQRFLRPC